MQINHKEFFRKKTNTTEFISRHKAVRIQPKKDPRTDTTPLINMRQESASAKNDVKSTQSRDTAENHSKLDVAQYHAPSPKSVSLEIVGYRNGTAIKLTKNWRKFSYPATAKSKSNTCVLKFNEVLG